MIRILLISFFITLSCYGQEDEGPRKISKRRKRSNVYKLISAQGDTAFGYNDNLYKTPKGSYLDPETGTVHSSSQTGGVFFNPNLNLTLSPIQKKNIELDFDYTFDGLFHFGDTNAKNANGQDQKLELTFSYIKKWNKNKRRISRKRKKVLLRKRAKYTKRQKRIKIRNKRKLKFKGEVLKVTLSGYSKKHDFSYLHRGTGGLRKTKTSKVDEESRYKYSEKGTEIKTRFTFINKSQITAEYRLADRDYEEVAVTSFGSFDRTVNEYKLKYQYPFVKDWKVRVSYLSSEQKYKTHKSNDTTGASVNGTLRIYEESEVKGAITGRTKKWISLIQYKIFNRDDTYAGYWSYEQKGYKAKLLYRFSKDHKFGVEYSLYDRQYKLETNADGVIRNRSIKKVKVLWEQMNSWGKIYASISSKSQDDTDSYYTYDQTVVMLGVVKSF